MRSSTLFGLAAPLLGQLANAYEVKTPPLTTDWTHKVGTDPWPEYPRPQLQRSKWQSLNGVWKFEASEAGQAEKPPSFDALSRDVLVPSCLESGLSGVMEQNITHAWFGSQFEIPEGWQGDSGRIMMHFDAVDYEATVFVNGEKAGFHRGGYYRFGFDVTDLLKGGKNTV